MRKPDSSILPQAFWNKVPRHPNIQGCLVWEGIIHKETGFPLFRGRISRTMKIRTYLAQYLMLSDINNNNEELINHTCGDYSCIEPTHMISVTMIDADKTESVPYGRLLASLVIFEGCK